MVEELSVADQGSQCPCVWRQSVAGEFPFSQRAADIRPWYDSEGVRGRLQEQIGNGRLSDRLVIVH